MDEIKKETVNKQKRTKSDLVKQAVLSYLQRRNYPIKACHKLSLQEFELENLVECEVSRPNSVLYSCFNSDPIVIDQTFIKFINWLKDLHRTQNDHSDLDSLTGPLFCHLYFEILRGGHAERAANFFTNHIQIVDKYKTDHNVIALINSIANKSADLPKLKENFRSHKFLVSLSTNSVGLLKSFLSDSAHVVLLQVLQNYFMINEIDKSDKSEDICDNVLKSSFNKNVKSQKGPSELLETISALNSGIPPAFCTSISNLKNEVTCGLMKRQHGIAMYCQNNAVIVKSLVTLKQLCGTDFLGDIVLRGHNKRVYDLSMVDNLKYLLSASEDKTVRLFDLNEYSQKNIYRSHDYPVYCITASSNGQYFISGSYDRTARLWALSRTECLRVYAGHAQEITCIRMHQNCTYFATGSADKNIRLWSISDGMPVRLYFGSKGTIYSLTFNNKGNCLVSASEDKKIRLWDLVAGRELVEFDTEMDFVKHLSISSDDKLLAVGTSDGIVKYWNFDELLKSGSDEQSREPIKQYSLTSKLFDIEYCFDSFGFLTCQQAT